MPDTLHLLPPHVSPACLLRALLRKSYAFPTTARGAPKLFKCIHDFVYSLVKSIFTFLVRHGTEGAFNIANLVKRNRARQACEDPRNEAVLLLTILIGEPKQKARASRTVNGMTHPVTSALVASQLIDTMRLHARKHGYGDRLTNPMTQSR